MNADTISQRLERLRLYVPCSHINVGRVENGNMQATANTVFGCEYDSYLVDSTWLAEASDDDFNSLSEQLFAMAWARKDATRAGTDGLVPTQRTAVEFAGAI